MNGILWANLLYVKKEFPTALFLTCTTSFLSLFCFASSASVCVSLAITEKPFQVRYIGVSNETSYGVMGFVHAAKDKGLPKIVSIQNSYSLLVRCKFESKLSSDSVSFSIIVNN